MWITAEVINNHSPRSDFDKNLNIFLARLSASPACSSIEESCSKPLGLCKFSVRCSGYFPKDDRVGLYFKISSQHWYGGNI